MKEIICLARAYAAGIVRDVERHEAAVLNYIELMRIIDKQPLIEAYYNALRYLPDIQRGINDDYLNGMTEYESAVKQGLTKRQVQKHRKRALVDIASRAARHRPTGRRQDPREDLGGGDN